MGLLFTLFGILSCVLLCFLVVYGLLFGYDGCLFVLRFTVTVRLVVDVLVVLFCWCGYCLGDLFCWIWVGWRVCLWFCFFGLIGLVILDVYLFRCGYLIAYFVMFVLNLLFIVLWLCLVLWCWLLQFLCVRY